MEELEREGIRHIPLHSSTRRASVIADTRAARELRQILRRERIDILHTHNPKPGLYGRIVGRLTGVPVVVNTVHGLYATEDDPWPKRALVYGLEAFAARWSDAELIQNAEDLALMQRWHLTKHAQLLGNGVDLARFDAARFDAAQRRASRRELGANDTTIVVGTVGRLVAEKGYPELFEAFEQLDRERYTLVVVGASDPAKPDALDPELVARARARGVQFLGHRDDVDALYAAMDVFVLASHREGFPRAAMEATAMSVPVIATDVRGCRQVVDDTRTGLLVAVQDSGAIARAVRALGEDADRRAGMASAARVRAREQFDEARVVQIVLDTYCAVAARKGLNTTEGG